MNILYVYVRSVCVYTCLWGCVHVCSVCVCVRTCVCVCGGV